MGRRKTSNISKGDTRIKPGPRNRAAMEAAASLCEERPVRPSLKWQTREGGQLAPGAVHNDDGGHLLQMLATFGTTSHASMTTNLGALELATRDRTARVAGSTQSLNAALALVSAIAPQDELEAALAVQMASCNALTLELLGKAKTATNADHLALYGNLAVKMQRTFTAQIEALGRMRGKGQQTVRVEHVTVQPGAQAIVGDVHHHAPGAPGGVLESENRPHAKAGTAMLPQGSPALPSPDQTRDGLSVAGHAERSVSHARRIVTRRSPRKPERAEAWPLEP